MDQWIRKYRRLGFRSVFIKPTTRNSDISPRFIRNAQRKTEKIEKVTRGVARHIFGTFDLVHPIYPWIREGVRRAREGRREPAGEMIWLLCDAWTHERRNGQRTRTRRTLLGGGVLFAMVVTTTMVVVGSRVGRENI